MIRLSNVMKHFGAEKVLTGITFEIPESKIIGIYGPNGSGKTTLIKILLGLVKPDSGDIVIDDTILSEKHLKMIGGYLPDAKFYPWLSGIENYKYFLGINENEIYNYKSLFYKLGLTSLLANKYSSYSSSTKKRFALAYLILQNKKFLLLDEPMTSLDIDGIKNLKEILKTEASKGKGVLIVSSHLEELEKFCDDIIVLKDGNIKHFYSGESDLPTYQLVFSSTEERKKAEFFINTEFVVLDPRTLKIKLKSDQDIESIIKELSTTSLIEVVKQKTSFYDLYVNNEVIN